MTSNGVPDNRRQSNLGRLDHPGRAADRIKFPKDFGPRFVVFVDTEEEFDWTKPRSREATSTTAIKSLPEFQRLMNAHGVRPCYLIDYPVATNPGSVETLRQMRAEGKCDFGTQLHPWVNPPLEEELTSANSFAGNLPVELERAKLKALTDAVAALGGERPIAYRAGRYGVGPNTAELLEAEGYRLDCSVRPGFDYSSEGGPNFLRHSARPFWAGPGGTLIELPLGTAYTGSLRRFGRMLIGDGHSNPRRISMSARLGLASRVALTPEEMPLADVLEAIDCMLGDGMDILSISFHSPSIEPGHTPYVRNSAELMQFYGWWEKVLEFFERRHIAPVSVGEIVEAAWSQRQ